MDQLRGVLFTAFFSKENEKSGTKRFILRVVNKDNFGFEWVSFIEIHYKGKKNFDFFSKSGHEVVYKKSDLKIFYESRRVGTKKVVVSYFETDVLPTFLS